MQVATFCQRHSSNVDLGLISAWISAHAGSGKTKTLVDRVLLLLLNDVDPTHILCLTFTKVAAREMTVRVLQALGVWAGCPQASLEDSLTQILGRKPSRAQQEKARQLFVKTLDTPGGLRIETLHGFCERLLRTFGSDIGVPAHFHSLDEREISSLRVQAARDVLECAAVNTSDSRLTRALSHLMEYIGESHLSVLLENLLNNWGIFLETYAQHHDSLEALFQILQSHFNLPLDLNVQTIENEMRSGALTCVQWEMLADRLMEGSATDQKTARRLRDGLEAKSNEERWEAYKAVFFTQSGAPRQKRTLISQKIDSVISEQLLKERDRLSAWEAQKNGLRACLKTQALLIYAGAVFKRLESLKREKGVLDFDDLIKRAYELLMSDSSCVLYHCDTTLRHILIDEAQDTSLLQWAIIKRISEEFTTGEGACGEPRTLFVVGDIKQSIYGFQGADPTQFLESRIYFKERHESACLPMAFGELTHSFRSTPAILEAVDSIFNQSEALKAVLGDSLLSESLTHSCERSKDQGCVEVWFLGDKNDESKEEIHTCTEDQNLPPQRPYELLGKKIAEQVKQWITHGDPSCALGPIAPHQILILLRARGEIFDAIGHSLHTADVPTAGLDRIDVMDHAVIRECFAIARVALLPQDEWILASALRSSVLGWNALDLLALRQCQKNHGYESLWEVFEKSAVHEDHLCQKTMVILELWKDLAIQGAFSFFSHLFSHQGARFLWEQNYGREVHDVLDIFLGLAYEHDQSHTPDLSLFLESCEEWLHHPIKRDLDLTMGVRIMTVHGAKGLEASHVIVVDDGKPPHELQRGSLFVPVTFSAGDHKILMPFWSAGTKSSLPGLEEAQNALQRESFCEHMRLLYVALTRARDHLVFVSFDKRKSACAQIKDEEETSESWPHKASWTAYVHSGLRA